jgi:hypothetical protein
MKILSEAEGQDWLRRNCQIDDAKLTYFFGQSVAYLIPPDSGRKTALARLLRGCLKYGTEGVFWITGWGVWPSSENIGLFDAYRKSLGEQRPLHDAPFHIFTEADATELECLLDLALYFFWDAILIDGLHTTAFRISHDEYIELYAKDNVSRTALTDVLERAHLQRMPRPVNDRP